MLKQLCLNEIAFVVTVAVEFVEAVAVETAAVAAALLVLANVAVEFVAVFAAVHRQFVLFVVGTNYAFEIFEELVEKALMIHSWN